MSKKVTNIKEVKENQIKVTYGELRNIIMTAIKPNAPSAYQKMITPSNPEKMSGKAKIKLMRLSGRLNPVLEIIEKGRMAILEKYCKKDENDKLKTKLNDRLVPQYTKRDGKGNPVLDIPKDLPREAFVYDFGTKENEDKFNKEWAEVLEDDAEIPGERITISADDIPDNILPIELGLLEKLIKFEE